MPESRYIHAINRALGDALDADPSVIVMGEDIAAAGGSFKATRGLLDRFGPMRIRDTPISELAITGAAVGAALSGLRPVVEIMFMDFVTLAMDAIVNQAAKSRFMFGGQTNLPMVVRLPHGGGLNAGPQHSQCLEAWFAHIPGLKVVCPATVEDAYGLLRAAIDDPDPVIVVEHKGLYGMSGDLPETPSPARIGEARTAQAGSDVTLVTYGAALMTCMNAARQLGDQGVSAEVIDLRSLQPWDKTAVLASVARTHRAVVVHEAVRNFGVGAEIAAVIGEEGFDDLDAPVKRVGAPFMPSPFARSLETRFIPDAGRVVAAALETLE
jgi:acetoin:2,6-dichlorophenolindophenol oxidoreductase subunit beta